MKVLSFLLGYLIGSFCISILLSRLLFHTDIRTQGSGNAGAANAARVFGMGVGIATFAGDFLKTVLAMWLGGLLAGDTGLVLAGFGCLIGHCWPAPHCAGCVCRRADLFHAPQQPPPLESGHRADLLFWKA